MLNREIVEAFKTYREAMDNASEALRKATDGLFSGKTTDDDDELIFISRLTLLDRSLDARSELVKLVGSEESLVRQHGYYGFDTDAFARYSFEMYGQKFEILLDRRDEYDDLDGVPHMIRRCEQED